MISSSDAYIVHQRPYRETSIIVDAFTERFGRMSLVVKGAKGPKSSKWNWLQPFNRLTLSWVGRSDLKTLTGCDPIQGYNQRLEGVALYSGLYLNELIYCLLKPFDAAFELFNNYDHCIKQLNSQSVEILLRQFEIELLQEVGFGIDFQYDVDGNLIEADSYYNYYHQSGFIKMLTTQEAAIKGDILRAISCGQWSDRQVLKNARQLLKPLIDQLLNGRELKSRQYFRKTSLT